MLKKQGAPDAFDTPIPGDDLEATIPGAEYEPTAPIQAPQRQTFRHRSPVLTNTFSAIKGMQAAILQFAETAAASDITSMQGVGTGKQEGNKGEYLGGSNPFGDFLARYTQAVPSQSGQQYVNTDVGSEHRGDAGAIQDTNLRGIINTLKQIGTPGKETTPDGIWKQRTDNALWQISKLMMTVQHLSKSMNIPIKGIDEIVDAFTKALPKRYTEIDESNKAELANHLTDLIHQMTAMFSSFRSSVLQDKDLSQYIAQEKPFAQYKQRVGNVDVLNPEEKKIYSNMAGNPVQGLQLAKQPISLYDLSSKETFDQLMQRINRNPKDPKQVQAALTELARALGGNVPPEHTSQEINVPADQLGY
jgi:hypothetical protein